MTGETDLPLDEVLGVRGSAPPWIVGSVLLKKSEDFESVLSLSIFNFGLF